MTAKVIPLRKPDKRAPVEKPLSLEEIERAMPWLMQGRGPKGHNF